LTTSSESLGVPPSPIIIMPKSKSAASAKPKAEPSTSELKRKSSNNGSSAASEGSRPKGKSSRINNLWLQEVATDTLDAIKQGHYFVNEEKYDLQASVTAMCDGTTYYEPDSLLTGWNTEAPSQSSPSTHISVLEITSIQSAQMLRDNAESLSVGRVGVLNFADAKKEGGLFLIGANAQEESIVRSSTLYNSLMTPTAQQYYQLHRNSSKGKGPKSPYASGYYSHAMIFTPHVAVFRGDDQEAAYHPPFSIDVVTSPAVNNRSVVMHSAKKTAAEREAASERVREEMYERMARILFLFEVQGIDSIVLGSFGTGVFRNDVRMVAEFWLQLLRPGSRFEKSFRNVVFGVIGHETFLKFKDVLGQLETKT
jgi:uncharacterized protein (TIGR02452 family)